MYKNTNTIGGLPSSVFSRVQGPPPKAVDRTWTKDSETQKLLFPFYVELFSTTENPIAELGIEPETSWSVGDVSTESSDRIFIKVNPGHCI